MPTEREKMVAGELYDPGESALAQDRAKAQRFMAEYNRTTVDDAARRKEMLKRHFGAIGMRGAIRAPIFVDSGYNIVVGDGVFMNYGCVLLDVCPIHIGPGCQIGPGVQFYAADHPKDPVQRASGLEMGKPIVVGANAWIGGHAIILPGVTIGEDAIIGAGSVVTRDVAAGARVAGNPARLL